MGLLTKKHIVLFLFFTALPACQTTVCPPKAPAPTYVGLLTRSAKGSLLFTPSSASPPLTLGTPLLVEKNDYPWGIFFLTEDPSSHSYPIPVRPACYVMKGTEDSYGTFTVRIPQEKEDFVHCLGVVLHSDFAHSPQTVSISVGSAQGILPGARFQLLQTYKGPSEPENQLFCQVKELNLHTLGGSVCTLEKSVPENQTLSPITYALFQPKEASPTQKEASTETPVSLPLPDPIPPIQHPDEVPKSNLHLKKRTQSKSTNATTDSWVLEAGEGEALTYFQEGTWFAAIPAATTTDTRPVAFFYLTKRPSPVNTPPALTEACRFQQPNLEVDIREGMALQAIKRDSVLSGPGRCLARVVREIKNRAGKTTAVTLDLGAEPSERSPTRGKYLFLLNENQQASLGGTSPSAISCRLQPRKPKDLKEGMATCKFSRSLPRSLSLSQIYGVAKNWPLTSRKSPGAR